jgi:hypothetical protein
MRWAGVRAAAASNTAGDKRAKDSREAGDESIE